MSERPKYQPEQERPPVVIREMPSKEDLEEFLGSMVGRHSTVAFNLETGEFTRLGEKKR